MYSAVQSYKYFGECLYLSNGTIEIIAALSFGIRILRFCIRGEENVFYEQPDESGYLCTVEGWRIYGGHRLWLAPESEKSYWPDNMPIEYEILSNGVLLRQKEDKHLNVKKSMRICFAEDPYVLHVNHLVKNCSGEPVTVGLWAISAMGKGSVLMDTDLNDERMRYNKEQVTISHLPSDAYFKIGMICREGIAMCDVKGQKFTKHFDGSCRTPYPDNNVNLEVYADKHTLEFETLSSLIGVQPDQEAEHAEIWRISKV